MANKVTIFGAGSVVFSLGLVKDLVSDQVTEWQPRLFYGHQ